MSLSAHERTQFARLTAGLELGDPSVLKKMARKDKATTMHYIPLPNRSAVMLFIVLINFCVFAGSVLANNGIAALLTGVLGTLLGAVVVRNATFGKSDVRKTAKHDSSYSPRISKHSNQNVTLGLVLLGLASIPVSFGFLLAHNYPVAFGILCVGALFIAGAGIAGALAKKNKNSF